MSYKTEIIDPGDLASKLAKEINVGSYNNCPALRVVPHEPDNFRGPVGYLWTRKILREMVDYEIDPRSGQIDRWSMMEEMENDGAGGKPQFFSLIGTPDVFRGLGWEIITMTADDFARSGRFPCIMDNELQVKRITPQNLPLVESLFQGYGEALKKANLVNITGEIAIMKHSITAFCDFQSDEQLILTWGASCIGLASQRLLLNGQNIKPGMPIVGFLENGYRCNGGTFFTNLILKKYKHIQNILDNREAREFILSLTTPSTSYAKTISRIIGWGADGYPGEAMARIAGIAHITGGGVWGKFGELLPAGVGAYLDNMPDPPDVLYQAQEMSQESELALSDYDAYGTLHGGCGMLLVANSANDADIIIREASRDGISAQVVGKTYDTGVLTIVSRFMNEGSYLVKKN